MKVSAPLLVMAGGPYHRGLSHQGIARTRDVVAAQPHLIAPVDRRLVPSGLPGNRRVFPLQPPRDGRMFLS
jgi:hypothetical protein